MRCSIFKRMLLLKDMAENSIDIIFAKPCVLGNSFDFSISISITYFFVIPFSRYLALFIIGVVLIVISTIPCACFYYTTFSVIVNGFIVTLPRPISSSSFASVGVCMVGLLCSMNSRSCFCFFDCRIQQPVQACFTTKLYIC